MDGAVVTDTPTPTAQSALDEAMAAFDAADPTPEVETPPAKVNGASYAVIKQLADTLGIDIRVEKSGTMYGEASVPLSVPAFGLKGTMKPTILSSFMSANGEDAGVLVRLSGDLHLFAFASDFDQTVILSIVDGSKGAKTTLDSYFERLTIRSKGNAMKYLDPKTVAKYSRGFDETSWAPLKG